MSDTTAQHPNPTPAVEVVATFGDSVVGVKHVANPRGGRISNATRALLVGGALALTGALGGFLYEAKIASDDAAAREKSILKGRPEWWYQAHQSSRGADVLFGLAGTLGLGALAWGLSRRKDERGIPTVSIGTGAGVDFAAPASPSVSFDLIAPNAARDGFVLNLAGGLVAEGAATGPEQPIALGTRTRVKCGAVTFHVSGVAAPARQSMPLLATLDRRVASYFAGSLVAHAAVLLLLRNLPPDPSSTTGDLAADEDIATKYTLVALEDPARTPITPTDDNDSGAADAHGNGIAMDLPGTKGRPDSNSVNPARLKSTGNISRDEAIAEARHAGILSPIDGELLERVTGHGDIDAGLENSMIDGIPDGADGGDGSPDGTFGHGTHGLHDGGDTTVAGDYNTIHDGRPTGSDFSVGPTHGHCKTGEVCRDHSAAPPPVHIGRPQGDPDVSAVVQRYIKQYKDQIGYCYEKALLGNPDLEGTVNVSFLLAANGAVLGVDSQGGNDEVASCIGGVVQGIKFPRLASEGSFQIKYPFVLHKPSR